MLATEQRHEAWYSESVGWTRRVPNAQASRDEVSMPQAPLVLIVIDVVIVVGAVIVIDVVVVIDAAAVLDPSPQGIAVAVIVPVLPSTSPIFAQNPSSSAIAVKALGSTVSA